MSASTPPVLDADLTAGLRRLKLAAMRQLAPELLVTAKTQRWSPEEVLRALVEAEITARDASNERARLKAATFPVLKTIEDFDLAASSIPAPTSGTALIDGQPYATLDQPLRTVGAMLDGASAVLERRGVDHLRWIAQSNRIPLQRIDEVLETVGLTDAAKVRVRKYSLGMKQRLGLAAALLGEPRILVLDEPVNGLDPEGIRTVRTFLRRYADQGNTVLLSSHLMGETAETVDDIVVINKGRIIADGTLDEITTGHGSLEDAFFTLTGSEPGTSW